MRGLRLCTLALGLGLAPPAAANDEDVGFLTRTLQSYLSDAGREVRIRGFEGALSSRATIEQMTIADAQGVWITLSGLVLDWDRGALLSRRLEINDLSAARIEIARPPLAEPPGPDLPGATARPAFALPELPVTIRIGQLRALEVVLGAPILGTQAELTLQGTARLEGGAGRAIFEAQRTDGALGRFVVAGGFDNPSRVLDLEVTLAEGPDGIAAGLLGIPDRPALDLRFQGRDPIAEFRADLRLATAGVERIAGRATFLDRSPQGSALEGAVVRLDLGGDLRPLLAPDLHGFFGAEARLVAEGQRDDDGAIRLSDLTATTRALTLQGRTDLDPDGRPRLIDLALTIADPSGGAVVLPGTEGQGRIAGADLAVAFDADRGPDWSVLGRVTDLSLPDLALAEVVLDARGRLGQDQGPLFDGVFEFASTGIRAQDPALQSALGAEIYGLLSLTAPGGGAPVALNGFSVEGQTISLSGQGALDGLTFDGFLEAEAPALAPFSGLAGRTLGGAALASLRGRLSPLTGAFDIDARLATTDLALGIPEADNLLAGTAAIDLSAACTTEGTDLRRLSVQAGTLDLGASGRIVPGASALDARLRLSDLTRLGT